jgi:hypothetical protein
VNRLHKQHIFTETGSSAVSTGGAAPSATERLYRPKFAR